MDVKTAILATQPTSYWPLDDVAGSSCHDEMGLHDASVPAAGVTLAAIPFGTIRTPFFDGALSSCLTIDNDPQYSQPFANALTVSVWICPLALDNVNVMRGSGERCNARSFCAAMVAFLRGLQNLSAPMATRKNRACDKSQEPLWQIGALGST